MSNALTSIQGEFQERVKNHIKDTFVSLVTEAEFARMVNAEIKAFFEDPSQFNWEPGGYSRSESLSLKITPFRQLVWSRVKTIVESELHVWFYGDQEKHFREFVKELLGSDSFKDGASLNVQQLMTVMAGRMFYNCAVQANMQMRSDLQGIFARQGLPPSLVNELTNMQTPGQYMPGTAPGSDPVQGSIYVGSSS